LTEQQSISDEPTIESILPESFEKKMSKSEYVYNFIKEGIVNGVWKAGDRINDKTIADHLNVNRLSVREALSRFIQNNIIIHRPWKGYFLKKFSPEEVLNFIDVRVALEQLAIKDIFKRDKTENKDYFLAMHEIISNCKQLLNDKNRSEYMRVDFSFHETIYKASRNPWITSIIINTRILVNILRNISMGDDDQQFWAAALQSIQDHEDILTALEDSNEKLAHSLMEEHLSNRFYGNIIKKMINN
jgi:DNA-binding GntR family transcriptional regulator